MSNGISVQVLSLNWASNGPASGEATITVRCENRAEFKAIVARLSPGTHV